MNRQVRRKLLQLALALAGTAALAQTTPRPAPGPLPPPGARPGPLFGPCKLHLTGAISADQDCQVLAIDNQGKAGVSVSTAPGARPASVSAVFSLQVPGALVPGIYSFAASPKATALAGDKSMPGPTFLADKEYQLGDGSLQIDSARRGPNPIMPLYEVHGSARASLVRGPDGKAPEKVQMQIEF
jgi:hypothetical protein